MCTILIIFLASVTMGQFDVLAVPDIANIVTTQQVASVAYSRMEPVGCAAMSSCCATAALPVVPKCFCTRSNDASLSHDLLTYHY